MHFINNFDYQLQEPWPATATSMIPLPPQALAALQAMPQGALCSLTLADDQQYEIITLQLDGQTLQALRAQEGTVAITWPAGTRVYAALTAAICTQLATGGPIRTLTAQGMFPIDYRLARRWLLEIQGAAQITLAPAPAGTPLELLLLQPADAGHAIELPAIEWQRGSQGFTVEASPCSVTRLQLTSLGSARWIGDAQLYGEAPQPPQPPAQELFIVWFYAMWSSSLGQGPYLSLLDASGNPVLSKRPGLPQGYNAFSAACAVSADNQWAAAFAGANMSPELVILNVNTGAEVTLDTTLLNAGPARGNLQFANDQLYAWSADGLNQIDPASGSSSIVSLATSDTPQAWSIFANILALNFNGTTVSAMDRPPVVLYDLTTGAELAEQLPLPANAQVGTPDNAPPSPFGAVGAFSGDGAYYALCVTMQFGADLNDSEQLTRLVIYDMATRQVLHTIEMPAISAYGSNLVWSRNGRYVAASHDDNAASAATVFDLQTQTTHTLGSEPISNSPLTMTNDGILVVANDGTPEAYNVATGQPTDWPAWLTGMDETDPTWGASRKTLSISSAWR